MTARCWSCFSSTTGLGKVSSHMSAHPVNPSGTWTVAAHAEMADLGDLLREGGLAGRKRMQMEAWAIAVDEVCSARRHSMRPRRELIALAAERLSQLRVYRPPEREDLLEIARRDLRTESIAALTAWSEEHDGRLACMAYEAWRSRHPESPTRNTIVRHFGTWYGALAAAGLEARAAASPATVAARHRSGVERRESGCRSSGRAYRRGAALRDRPWTAAAGDRVLPLAAASRAAHAEPRQRLPAVSRGLDRGHACHQAASR